MILDPMKHPPTKSFAIAATLILAIISWYLIFPIPIKLYSRDDIQSVIITDRNGVPLREKLSPDETRSQWLKLKEISPNVVKAFVYSEDKRFWQHMGVDPIAAIRSFILDIKARRIISGASTITMQLARLLEPSRRTVYSKIREMIVAQKLELKYSKKKILEEYLNRAPFGNGLVGIEAASRVYLGKPAIDLTLPEAVFLSVIPRSPTFYNPIKRWSRVDERYTYFIKHMYDDGVMGRQEFEFASKLNISPSKYLNLFSAPHFVDMLNLQDARGTVTTTLDLSLQRDVEMIVAAHIDELASYNATNASVVVIDNKTGEVLSLVGSRDYGNPMSGQVNGATSLRQPGSALKPFVYALAIDSGYSAATILPDIEMHFATPKGDYTPRDYDERERGPVTLRYALANSLNIPAVYTVSMLGENRVLSKYRELHLTGLTKDASYYGVGLALGNAEVRLIDLANAYATIARGGEYLDVELLLYETKKNHERIFSKDASYIISDILSDQGARREGFGEDSPLDLPFKVAAKTGTSKDYRDNWTVGYTPEYTVGVWVGNFDGSPMRGVSGVSGAGPIFHDVFMTLEKRYAMSWFEMPDTIKKEDVCSLSGKVPTTACPHMISEIFTAKTMPYKNCDMHVLKEIDTRNNLLAGKSCDKNWIQERGFLDLSHSYQNWVEKYGVDVAPREYSPLCPSDAGEIEKANRDEGVAKIINPRDKTVYILDVDIPKRLQVLNLRSNYDDGVWSVDGNELSNSSWQLARGRHKVELKNMSGAILDVALVEVR